jgi:phosphatidylserine decarboxylase precursor
MWKNPADELKHLLEAHPEWGQLLLDSLKEAKEIALRRGMERARNWPDTIEKYLAFIDKSAKLVPHQDYPRETFNTLATFYWLLDQPSGRKLQESDEFNEWMHDFARAWGSFLDTPESAAGIPSFEKDPAYAVWQYMPNPSGWLTFNQFFAREMRQGLRPIAGINNDDIVVSPADSTFKEKFHIDADSRVTIKHTHTYSVLDLLEDSPYKADFHGGLFAHAFLGPSDYHRFRAPVRGTVLECRAITGRVYLDVQINSEGEFEAADSAGDGYEFTQERGLIVFDSPVGLVACLPIGMAQVSSVNMTAVEGAYLRKGEEFGYFAFGGSDIILLFQEGSGIEYTAAPGVHTNCGMVVAQRLG